MVQYWFQGYKKGEDSKIKHAHIHCIVKTLTNYNIIEYSLINKLNLGII